MSRLVVTILFFQEPGCNSNSGSGGNLNTSGIKTQSLEIEIFTYFNIKCLQLLNKSQNFGLPSKIQVLIKSFSAKYVYSISLKAWWRHSGDRGVSGKSY
jgi:hypothetical protein